MGYARKIILQLPMSNPTALPEFVEACVKDKVKLIAIWGPGSKAVEDLIDDIIVGDGSDAERFIVTSSHDDELLEDVVNFATSFDGNPGEAQLVTL